MPLARLTLAVVLLVGLQACEEPTGPDGIELMVQVVAARAPTGPSGSQALAPGVEGIDIVEAVVVLGGLGLKTAGLDSTVDWAFEEPVVVPLRLGGEPTLAFALSVPEGAYGELQISLSKLGSEDPADQVLLDVFPRLEETSVLIRGTVTRDGTPEPFLFKSAVDASVELTFDRAERFSESSVKLYTLTFDLDEWFVPTPGGELLDPNDEADRPAIEGTLVGSLELERKS